MTLTVGVIEEPVSERQEATLAWARRHSGGILDALEEFQGLDLQMRQGLLVTVSPRTRDILHGREGGIDGAIEALMVHEEPNNWLAFSLRQIVRQLQRVIDRLEKRQDAS